MPEPTYPLVPAAAGGALAAPVDLVAAFLQGRSAQTLRAYRKDLDDFAAFVGEATADAAARRLLAHGNGPANGLALGYRAHLLGRGLSPATVNRRLAALRSLVQLARTLGVVAWCLDVEGVRSESYRDTRGPGRDGFRRLLAKLAERTDAKGLRDRALLRLLYDLGLRRKEAVGLDLADLDLEAGTVMVLGKGRSEKARLTLPAPTKAVLVAWLAVRGSESGPVFVRLDRAGKGKGRLTGSAVYAIVRGLGEATGVKARPHGLRHAAISQLLDLTNGNIREVQQFSRHKDVATVLKYDDARRDAAGELARRLAEDAG